MTKIHLWQEEVSIQSGELQVGFTLEEENGTRTQVWYRLSEEYKSLVSKSCEPFVLASIFTAMRTPSDLIVHGDVAPSLLFNLTEFQATWSIWKPKIYKRIQILPESELERKEPNTTDAVMAFSGGVDSCFSAWRNKKINASHIPYSLKAGVFVHGIEIPLKYEESFEEAQVGSKKILNSIGMDLIPIKTNQRILQRHSSDSQGAVLASCLMLLQGGFICGILAGSHNYRNLNFPYGTNPLTDPLLSSASFPIKYDGANYSRLQKISQIGAWQEARENLRVCMGRVPRKRSRNCCHCEKCTRTILEFHILGLGLPSCFEQDVTNQQLKKLRYLDLDEVEFYDDILAIAKNRGMSEPWVKQLQSTNDRNQIRLKAEQNILYCKTKEVTRSFRTLIKKR